ncbi:MAG: hypothetical protein DI537_10450 [Stutzerimonas stutzeri]|nr:MAG: hypothetical protein DI537_10450 [Stutzerimonas stutzeri]
MTAIAALSTIRITALDQADDCESVFAMRLRLNLARELARIIEDLRNGTIAMATTLKAGWAKIAINEKASCDDEREGLTALLNDVRELGIEVCDNLATFPEQATDEDPEFVFHLAA